MSKYDQLLELIEELLDLFVIEYDTIQRKKEDARIILSNMPKDGISKIRTLVLQEGLMQEGECLETKFFRHVISKFEEGDETCSNMVKILAEKFLPHLAVVCPVSDEFLHHPYGYIRSLNPASYHRIGLCFDMLNYVLQN